MPTRSLEDIKGEALSGAGQGAVGYVLGSSLGLPAGIIGNRRLTDWAGKPTLQGESAIVNKAVELLRAGSYPETKRDLNFVVNRSVRVPEFRLGDTPKEVGKLPVDDLLLPTKVSPQTIAHESGHAIAPNKAERTLRRLAELAGKNRAMLAIPSVLAATGLIEEADPVSKAAPYVGGAQLATILAEEARANIRGAKMLEAVGHKMPILNKIRMFLPTTSYLGRAGILVGAPLGIRKGIEAYRKSKERGVPIQTSQHFSNIYTPEELGNLPTPQEVRSKWEPYYV